MDVIKANEEYKNIKLKRNCREKEVKGLNNAANGIDDKILQKIISLDQV